MWKMISLALAGETRETLCIQWKRHWDLLWNIEYQLKPTKTIWLLLSLQWLLNNICLGLINLYENISEIQHCWQTLMKVSFIKDIIFWQKEEREIYLNCFEVKKDNNTYYPLFTYRLNWKFSSNLVMRWNLLGSKSFATNKTFCFVYCLTIEKKKIYFKQFIYLLL